MNPRPASWHHISLALCSLALVACTSPPHDLTSMPPGKYKNLATQLAARNPKADATAFHRAGGIGYFMTYGGLRMPMGGPDMNVMDSRDFESLQPFAPALYSQIYPLTEDPEGGLTMEHFRGNKKLTPARQSYQKVRSTYATDFNKRMLFLATPRTKQPSPIGR